MEKCQRILHWEESWQFAYFVSIHEFRVRIVKKGIRFHFGTFGSINEAATKAASVNYADL